MGVWRLEKVRLGLQWLIDLLFRNLAHSAQNDAVAWVRPRGKKQIPN